MRIKAIFLILLLAPPALASAQSLEECLDYAFSHSLRMQQADLMAERARTMEKTAFEMSPTSLSLSQDPTSGGSPDNALILSQEFDFPSVYAGRRKVLQAGTAVEEKRRELTCSELRRDVSAAYCTLLARMHVVELLENNAKVLEQFVDMARSRLEAGEAGRLEMLGATRLKAANDIRLREAQNRRREASLDLQLLMNSDSEIVPSDSYVPVAEICAEYSFGSTPAGALSLSEIGLSQQSLTLVRQEGFLPSFNVGLRRQMVLGAVNPYGVDRSRFEGGNWMGFEAGIAMPLFFGPQRKKVAAAKLDVEIARSQLEQKQNEAEAALTAATGRLDTARETYDYYVSEALPEAQELRKLSSLEYASGDISYVEYMQNLSTALETELDASEAADKLNQAIIEMNYIKGY